MLGLRSLDVWLIKPEDSVNPLFMAVLGSVSWVGKLVNRITDLLLMLDGQS